MAAAVCRVTIAASCGLRSSCWGSAGPASTHLQGLKYLSPMLYKVHGDPPEMQPPCLNVPKQRTRLDSRLAPPTDVDGGVGQIELILDPLLFKSGP